MAFIVHKDRMQVRRSYKAIWEQRNPVLLEGEIGFEIDTNKIKIGNGINGWNNLTFLIAGFDITGNAEGGSASSIYLNFQNIDGGEA